MNAISIPSDDANTGNTTSDPAKKPQMSATVTLTGPDGATLQIVAERRPDGARTYILATDAAKKTTRGMRESHETFDAAKAAIEKSAKTAEKLGWKRRAPRVGFTPKPDAFKTMPAPAKAKK